MEAPWNVAKAEEQLYVLVTGANSGIGLGIAQRLIDVHLDTRAPTAHLVLLVTTRSEAKSLATLDAIRAHMRARGRTAQEAARIHLAGIELDLCRLPSVLHAARALAERPLPITTGFATDATLARLPRLDVLILNAGIGGWTGFDMLGLVVQFLTAGLVQATTFPSYKNATTGVRIDPLTGKRAPASAPAGDHDQNDGTLGEVFCANVFGHYLLSHELLPLLRRDAASASLPPARIVWESSVEACRWDALSVDDLQGVRTAAAYESSKRLTDVLALTSGLPGVQPVSASFLAPDVSDAPSSPALLPRIYLSHPGVVCSSLFPLHPLIFYLYYAVMYVSRWAGSPWHPVTAYLGATAAVWLALEPAEALDAQHAETVKWGASVDRAGHATVKSTEVEGWGWDGALAGAADEDPSTHAATPHLRKSVGRHTQATDLTAERRQDFEVLGRMCWQEMERLRTVWTARVNEASKKA